MKTIPVHYSKENKIMLRKNLLIFYSSIEITTVDSICSLGL